MTGWRHEHAREALNAWASVVLIVAVCVAVYVLKLGERPLDGTEGHRAIPGWHMLASHDWWHQRLFELTYIRKPPGMPWAIAALSAYLGQTELAARLVSALALTLSALTAWWFVRTRLSFAEPAQPHSNRLARRAALFAGLIQAIAPLFWTVGRSADIEMLNNLGVQWAALGLVGLLIRRPSTPSIASASPAPPHPSWRCGVDTGVLGWAALSCLGIVLFVIAKGPAGAPVAVSAVIGALIVDPAARLRRSFIVLLPLMAALAVIIPMALSFHAANADPAAVREHIGGFLWQASTDAPPSSNHAFSAPHSFVVEKVLGVLSLAPLAALSAMPISLGLLILIRRPTEESIFPVPIAARALALGWLLSLAMLMLVGVSNPRYAMPAAMLLIPPAGVVIARLTELRATTGQIKFARACAWSVTLALFAGAAWFSLFRPRGDSYAGKDAAVTLAGAVPRSATLWADDAIEARPDVLWYMQQESRRLGNDLRVIWAKPRMLTGEHPDSGTFVLIRKDAGSNEQARYSPDAGYHYIKSAKVRTYEFVLLERN